MFVNTSIKTLRVSVTIVWPSSGGRLSCLVLLLPSLLVCVVKLFIWYVAVCCLYVCACLMYLSVGGWVVNHLHLTAVKTNWNSEGLTESLVLLPAIRNAKFSCFHLNTQNLHFCFQEISGSDVIGLYVVFSFLQQTAVTSKKWWTPANHALQTLHACSPGFTTDIQYSQMPRSQSRIG
jgi:hypothetical protein